MPNRDDEPKTADRATFDAFWDKARAQGDTLTPDEVRQILVESE